MTNHVNMPDNELHEPKGMQLLTGGATDVGKVVVSKGDGTSEARKLAVADIDGLGDTTLLGTYYDPNTPTSTIEVAVEGNQNYLIGAVATQVVSVKLPNPATIGGARIYLKRLDANDGDGSAVKFIPFNSETIEGQSELALTLQNTTIAVVSDGTNWRIANDMYPVKPLFGFWDYNDLATASTPLNASSGVPLALTNDEAGAFTNKTYKPEGTTDIWDAVGGVFDFSELSLGDTVDIRLDVSVTTTGANQNVDLYLELGQGGSAYPILFDTVLVKSASTKQIVSFSSVYMGDNNTLNNAAQFFILTDGNATVTVNGWYVRVVGARSTY